MISLLTATQNDVLDLLHVIRKGYDYDPGSSDLDDEQPIHVSMPLGVYRLACRLEVILREGK